MRSFRRRIVARGAGAALRRAAAVLRGERGAVLIVMALGIAGFLAVAALALDLGMLYTARTESQRVADGAALAGAGWLAQFGDDEESAREEAIRYAAMHEVRGETVEVLPEDVDVLLDERLVRVRVRHTAERESAIPTYMARVIGIDEVDVATVATARVDVSVRSECILPLAMADRWCEESGAPCALFPNFDPPDSFDEADDDWYEEWDPEGGSDHFTGYTDESVGDRILIKPGDPNDAWQPGWFYPFRIPGNQGGADYREAICECVGDGVEWGEELEVDTEPGNMIGPTKQGFRCLEDKDPDAVWNETANDGRGCVTDAGSDQCRHSPRIRPMVMFAPDDPPDPGAQPFRITNFVGVFFEEVQGNDVWVRFVKYMGDEPSTSGDDELAPGLMVESIRLVE